MIQSDSKLMSLYLEGKNRKPTKHLEHVGLVLAQQLPMNTEKARFFLFLAAIDKCLIAFRQRRLRSGNFYHAKFSRMDRVFPEQISFGTMALTGGLEGYLSYVSEDYGTAEAIMRAAIRNSIAQSDLTPAFIGSAFEQWLNLMRLLTAMDDYARLEEDIWSYFMFLNGIPRDNHFIFTSKVLGMSRQLEEEDFLKHHFFIIEAIYARLLGKNKEETLLDVAKETFLERNLFSGFVAVMSGTADRFDLEKSLPYYHLFPEKLKRAVDGIFAQ